MARILFFGVLRDIVGPTLDVVIGPKTRTVSALRAQLCASHPELEQHLDTPHVRVAVDLQFATEFTPIKDHSEIAFMPPMSGG